MDWLWLATSGFLTGAFLYSARLIHKDEPHLIVGHLLIALGLATTVCVNIWLDHHYHPDTAIRTIQLASYLTITCGITINARLRRIQQRQKHGR